MLLSIGPLARWLTLKASCRELPFQMKEIFLSLSLLSFTLTAAAAAVVQLWFTLKRNCLSVVECIYHSEMFFRSIWNTKRVPETWWGFSIRISRMKHKNEGEQASERTNERERTASSSSRRNNKNVQNKERRKGREKKLKLIAFEAAESTLSYLTTTIKAYNFILYFLRGKRASGRERDERREEQRFLPNLVECFCRFIRSDVWNEQRRAIRRKIKWEKKVYSNGKKEREKIGEEKNKCCMPSV